MESKKIPKLPKKKSRKLKSDDDDLDSLDEILYQNKNEDETEDSLEANFLLNDPAELYYHGVRLLLTKYTLCGLPQIRGKKKIKRNVERQVSDDAPVATTLADCIVNQGNIGTVICLEGEDTVVGFSTIINIKQYPKSGINELMKLLQTKAQKRLKPTDFSNFNKIVFKSEHQMGLFLSERYYNIPPKLPYEVLKHLKKDVKWSQSSEIVPPEEKPFYFFDYIIVFSTCYILENKQTKLTGENPIRFPKYEDEVFVNNSEVYFTFPMHTSSRIVNDDSMKTIEAPEHKLVCVLKYSEFKKAKKECKRLLKNL